MFNDNFRSVYVNMIKEDTIKNDASENRLDKLIQQYSNIDVPTKQDIIDLLNIAIMDEYLAEYNYFASYNLSRTQGKTDFDPEFQQHQEQERSHRKDLVNRLRQFDVEVPIKLLQQYLTQNSAGQNWKQELSHDSYQIIKNRFKEQCDAIKFYSLIFTVLRKLPDDQRDTTTQMLIKRIKADQEGHKKDLHDLMIQRGISEEDDNKEFEFNQNNKKYE